MLSRDDKYLAGFLELEATQRDVYQNGIMSYPLPLIRDIRRWFRPAIDAIFTWNLPWSYRWRLLLLQPLEFLGHMLKTVPYVLKRPFTVEWIQVRPGEFFRVLVFKPKGLSTSTTLRPIHVSIHGGAFCK